MVVGLFPGQGAEFCGMGRAYYGTNPAVKRVMDRANAVLDFDLLGYMFGEESLSRHPEWLQPALVTYHLGMVAAFEANHSRPEAMCGLSLGEYSALIAAGACSLEDGMRLVAARSQAMARAAAVHPGAMLAVMKPTAAALEEALAVPDVWLANRNSHLQVVLGGTTSGISAARKCLATHGVRGIKLRVTGAFHTPLMASAQADLAQALRRVAFTTPEIPVMSTTALTYFTRDNIAEILAKQVATSTDFCTAIAQLSSETTNAYVQFSEKDVLGKMVANITPGAQFAVLPAAESVEEIARGN